MGDDQVTVNIFAAPDDAAKVSARHRLDVIIGDADAADLRCIGSPRPDAWWNAYVGIPYVAKGRDRGGCDCWGLVRLVHAERFGNLLPSLSGEYEADDDARIAELIATRREGWSPVEAPRAGDVVVLRIDGADRHIGIVASPGRFLHVREGRDAVIARLDSAAWRHRVAGFYRYTPAEAGGELVLAACPHPLKTLRVDGTMPAGMSLAELAERVRRDAGLHPDMGSAAVIMVDGVPVPPARWRETYPAAGSRVEYRAVPGKDAGRIVLTLAVMAAAWYAAPAIIGYGFGTAGWAAANAAGSGLAASLVSAGINMAGSLLINAIFPTRPPSAPKDPGQAVAMHMLAGGQNQPNRYGPIPVVLGRYRYTPPLGANTYSESTATVSYLRMLLVWGYGPLQISDIRIGDTPLSQFEEVEEETLTGWGDTPEDVQRFNALYGRDVAQEYLNVKLECTQAAIAGVTRAGNVVTVATTAPHGFSAGWSASLSGVLDPSFNVGADIDSVPTASSFTIAQVGPDASSSGGVALGRAWTNSQLGAEVDRIGVTLHFPEGLRQIVMDGKETGRIDPAGIAIVVQARQLDPNTLLPLTGWGNVEKAVVAKTINLPPAWYNVDDDAALEAVYRWTRISLDATSRLVVRHGAFTVNPNQDPSGGLLARLQDDNYGLNATFGRLPDYGPSEEPLWDICVLGDAIYSTVDRRTAGVTGCGLTMTGLAAAIAAGTVERAQTETLILGNPGTPYAYAKDAFTWNVDFDVAAGIYEVRAGRFNVSTKEFYYPSGNRGMRYHDCYLVSATGYRNARPIVPPAGVKLAMTAIRIRATNQINGNVDGIVGTAQVICLDWDSGTSSWVRRATRNPASLYRHVLQHPGNAKRVADADILLDELADWHEYCQANGFMFDAVATQQRSVEDTLRDIAAAGRASPTRRDGKRTVVIDRPRTDIAQIFTPHNSWGFQGVHALPRLPHAWRVPFVNSERGYQPDERVVYADGYSSVNATLYESLNLPGVSTPAAIFKHARFHYAQLKLRPATYHLYSDIENLICTRGDLVRANHDVPLWGLGSGRIKERVDGTHLTLDEPVPMDAGTQYAIRIRLEDGTQIVRTVAAAVADGWYADIALTAAVSATEGKPGNLFAFGAIGQESVEAIVLAIEPADNLSARLTLVDYSPAVYDSDTEPVPAFDSQITLPPTLMQPRITGRPVVTAIVSDESVMTRLAPGVYAYAILVSWRNPANVEAGVTHVEGQIAHVDDDGLDWEAAPLVAFKTNSLRFGGVQEGQEYKLRLRYVDGAGRTGGWSDVQTHIVTGRANPPSAVTGLTAAIEGLRIRLDWTDNTEPDVEAYEVRTADSGWGDGSHAWRGRASTCLVNHAALGVARTWYVRAVDSVGLYSEASASVSKAVNGPPAPAGLSAAFVDTSNTLATCTLDWLDAAPDLGLSHYIVQKGAETPVTVRASQWTTQANWTGAKTFSVQTVDAAGNVSAATQLAVTKALPGTPTDFRARVIDNNVLLYWTAPVKTSLPVVAYELRKGATWAGGEVIGRKSGGFTVVFEEASGSFTYWIAAIDSDDRLGSPVAVTARVNEPPDYIHQATFESTFAGTKTNAWLDEYGDLKMLVNTTETWATHFTARSWTTIQNQIDAGYPRYLQPNTTSASYIEDIDYGATLAATLISVALSTTSVNAPTLTVNIKVKLLSGDSWTDLGNVSSAYATNIRYIRITLTAAGSNDDLVTVTQMTTKLSLKKKTDAGMVACLASDAGGTQVNFAATFIDVASIVVTPAAGGSAAYALYDFTDAPNPTGMKVLLYNAAGGRVDGNASWTIVGH